ncbi:unnamed protein product [Trichobilharzia szidati]|nr:unnamed protein product [Trichobilharzia szidati]
MLKPETKIAVKLMILSIFVHLWSPGFQFLSNQFTYYRFLTDAGLPYEPPTENKSLPDPDKELRDEVQKKTAHFVPLLNIALLLPGIVSSFIISSLSDHYGRRLAMGVLFIGLTSNVIISSFVILLELNINFLILACLMSGCFGGGLLSYSGQIAVCCTDITNIPSEEELVLVNSENIQASMERRRLLYLGVYDAICVLSSAAAITVTGVLIDHYGFVATCLVLLSLCALSMGILWCVPETQLINVQVNSPPVVGDNLGADASPDQLESNINRWLSKLTSMFRFVRNANVTTIFIIVVLFLTTLTTYGEGQYTFLYLMGPPFNWSVDQYGYYSGISNALLGLLSFILIMLTIHWMKLVKQPQPSESTYEPLLTNQSVPSYNSVHEVDSIEFTRNRRAINRIIQNQVLRARRRTIKYALLGMFSIVVSKLLMGIAYLFSYPGHNILIFVSLIVCTFRSAVVPVLKSFVSTLYKSRLQSRLFSVVAASEYLGLLTGMATLPFIYAASVSYCSGTVFIVSSGLALIAFVLLLYVSRYTKVEIRRINLNQPNVVEVGE